MLDLPLRDLGEDALPEAFQLRRLVAQRPQEDPPGARVTSAASRAAHTSAGPTSSGRERSASAGRPSIGPRTPASMRSAPPRSSVTCSQVVAIARGKESGGLPASRSSPARRSRPARKPSGVVL
jgi:hypothetical protein